MNLYKYDGESSRKNITDTSSTSSSSNSSISGNLWGNDWAGGSVDSTIYTNGNIFIYGSEDNEDEDDDESLTIDTRVPRDEDEEYLGCLFADDGLFAKRSEFKDYCYANEQYLNYPDKNGVKTNILDLFKQIVPVGSIIMHNGSVTKDVLLSYGWAVCDGSNGTPDLTGKFVKGGTTAGATGGSSSVSLTTANLPSHSHTYNTASSSTSTAGSHSHTITSTEVAVEQSSGINTIGAVNNVSTTNSTGDHSHTITLSSTNTGSVGSGSSFNIEPPYYTLIYIMRVK